MLDDTVQCPICDRVVYVGGAIFIQENDTECVACKMICGPRTAYTPEFACKGRIGEIYAVILLEGDDSDFDTM